MTLNNLIVLTHKGWTTCDVWRQAVYFYFDIAIEVYSGFLKKNLF